MTRVWSRSVRRAAVVVILAASMGAALTVQSFSASSVHRTALNHELDLFGEVVDLVRERYVDTPSDKKMIEGAINGMLSALDPHSSYMTDDEFEKMTGEISGEFGGVGLEVEDAHGGIRVVTVLDGTPASKSGLQTNDTIVKIDGQDTSGMSIDKAVTMMHGAPGTKVTLTVTRKGSDAPISVSLKRDIIRVSPVQQRAEGNIAYIRIATFNGQTGEKLAAAIASSKKAIGPDIKGYVLDLRNNPGGLLDQAVEVSSELITKGGIVSIKGRKRADNETFSADSTDLTNGKPIVVLINSGTASAAEIVAGALQDDKRAMVVGTRSFGKGTVQTIVPLGGKNGALRLTTARYFTPSGRSIQAKGIEPDVNVDEKIPETIRETLASEILKGGERSLANHLKNPDGETAQESEPAAIPYIPENANDDTQLQFALDFLKKLPAGAQQVDITAPPREMAATTPRPVAP
ncbi:S41 family peptidase [Hyphomicrobium sp.]|uniref:S41 family peptidase n=1 Tax=Hyphomicrobium sp. TaxID=82 RepID=UPI002E341374|nr:S41 family peptidase [Hyphomicrobium sp.]HEX2841058.1 S41 family peptidase [Hyphomicrobium sp.]